MVGCPSAVGSATQVCWPAGDPSIRQFNDLFIGIDISKHKLDIAFGDDPQSPVESIDYTDEQVNQLVKRLQAEQPKLIVLEATGGLERPLMEALQQGGLPVARVQPRRVRAFAYAAGLLAKTDRLDARLLAQFGRNLMPSALPRPDETRQEARDLLARRSQLLEIRIAESNRLGTASCCVREHIQRHLEWLDEEIANLEKEIEERMNASDELRQQRELLQSVPGVGKITACMLAASLEEVQTRKAKQVASFCLLGSPLTPIRVAQKIKNDAFMADEQIFAMGFTWPPYRPRASILSSVPSFSACKKLVNPSKLP